MLQVSYFMENGDWLRPMKWQRQFVSDHAKPSKSLMNDRPTQCNKIRQQSHVNAHYASSAILFDTKET